MLLRAGLFYAYADGDFFFRGKVAPFSAVRMGFIYREIEGGSRRGNLNHYWSLIRPVLVAARSSIGIYCQPVLVGRATSTGSFFYLYRLRRAVEEEGSCLPEGGIAASLWRDRGVVHGVSCFFVSLCAVYQIVPSESMRIDRVLSPSTGRVVCALPVSHSYRVRPREDLSL